MDTVLRQRFEALGLQLPKLPSHQHNLLKGVTTGSLVFVSGQTPMVDGEMVVCGRLGKEMDVASGRKAARLAALNLLAELDDVVGLEHVTQIVKLNGYVASADGFSEQPSVVDGASDLLVEVLGDRGRHARVAIGVAALPRNAAVEIDLVAEVG